ncbi:MAG: sensor histidine kinase [Mucilaginibacter sp.]
MFFLINFILRLILFVFPESVTRAQNFPEFNFTNWIYIAITPIFYIVSQLLLNRIRKTKQADMLMIFFVFVFSFYIILCGMYSSFIATSDPRNALTIYLIALCVISAMCVFEYDEALLLLILTEAAFTALLLYSQADGTEMLYSQLISIFLLSGFYMISRYFFSYKASYYQQIIEIREQNAAIEKATNFKTQVLGMVAHDLRNPIGAVESIAMMMELEDVDESTQENVSMIKESCAKARGIINDLLDAARNDNDHIMATTKTELNGFLRHLVNVWQIQKAFKSNVIFNSSNEKVYAKINQEKFQRVIDNLISNALKFSKDNDRVLVTLSEEKKDILIKIQDQGMGIPASLLPHIFDSFSKAGRTGLRGEQSTGLGLSIVKQIVESHSGSIRVVSTEGEGSVFTITLPRIS